MSLKDFISILRPVNCVMAGLGAFIGYSIASGLIQFQLGIGMAMVVAFLICAGGMTINDYFDRVIDKKLHPNKAIPSGRVKAEHALIYSMLLFLAGNLLAFIFLPRIPFAITFIFTILLMVYSKFLSKAKYIGNFVVASSTAFTLIFGASLIGNYYVAAVLAFSALFVNLARELIKDLEDIKADRGFKKTLPMMFSEGKIDAIIFVYYLIAIGSVYVPVVWLSFGKPLFVTLVSISNFIFLYSFKLTVKKDYSRAQLVSKAAMFLALFAFLLGVI